MYEFYRQYLDEFQATLASLDFAIISEIAEALDRARHAGKTIFVMGNGGSSASAIHWVCDLAKGTVVANENVPRFQVHSPSSNLAWLTALGNDLSYSDIFVEQLKNFLSPGDVVVGLSVSGDSENVVRAFSYAKEVGAQVISIVGQREGRMKALSDIALVVPSENYGIVEDVHMFIVHVVSQYLRSKYGKQNNLGRK